MVAVAVFSFTLSASAQLNSQATTSPTHLHPGAAPTQRIDGSVSPENIPDSTAYRLVFLVAGKSPDVKPEDEANEYNRQQAHLKKFGISDQDTQLIIPILDDFRARYAELVKQYNYSAKSAVAAGQAPDIDTLIMLRDSLVQSTRDKLNLLSPDGIRRLDEQVQREKKNMKVTVPASH